MDKQLKWAITGLVIIFAIWFLMDAVKTGYDFFYGRFYEQRCIDCPAKELLPDFKRENRLKIKFPEKNGDIKTAKSRSIESAVAYVIKFSVNQNGMEEFIKSFPETIKFEEFAKENSEIDNKRYMHLESIPKWFQEPIKKGKIGVYYLTGGQMFIFIDNSNENKLIIYLHGWFNKPS